MDKTEIKNKAKGKHRKLHILFLIILLLFLIYEIAVYFLVSTALVPSFMEKLEFFSRATEAGVSQQAHTSDIQENSKSAWDSTYEWFERTEKTKLEAVSEDGYKLIAGEFISDTLPDPESGLSDPESALSDPDSDLSGAESDLSVSVSHKWVLLVHGYTGKKEEMYRFCPHYAKQGFNILVPDLRAQGESEGDFIGMGLTDSTDCIRVWLKYIIEKDPMAEIVIHGQSMGAAAVLMMSGSSELPPNVRAVVSDCSYTDAFTMFCDKITEWIGLPSWPFIYSMRHMLLLRGGYDLREASALQGVQHSSLPTLFIHGASDKFVPVSQCNELYDAAACKKDILIVEGAGHAQSFDKDPEACWAAVDKLISEALS